MRLRRPALARRTTLALVHFGMRMPVRAGMRMPARAEATGLALKNEAGSQAFRRMPSPNQPGWTFESARIADSASQRRNFDSVTARCSARGGSDRSSLGCRVYKCRRVYKYGRSRFRRCMCGGGRTCFRPRAWRFLLRARRRCHDDVRIVGSPPLRRGKAASGTA